MLNEEVTFVDLQAYPLPIYRDGDEEASGTRSALLRQLEGSSCFILASPVYNYGIAASLKNLLEHCGSVLEGKLVAMVLAAGGARSYMSPAGFLSSLMLEYRCWIAPRYVYATEVDFIGREPSAEIIRRVDELALLLSKARSALHPILVTEGTQND